MSILAHDPDVLRRQARLTRASRLGDTGHTNWLAALAVLEDCGVDRDEIAATRRAVEKLARWFNECVMNKGREGF